MQFISLFIFLSILSGCTMDGYDRNYILTQSPQENSPKVEEVSHVHDDAE